MCVRVVWGGSLAINLTINDYREFRIGVYFLIASSLFTFLLLLMSFFCFLSWASCFLICFSLIRSS